MRVRVTDWLLVGLLLGTTAYCIAEQVTLTTTYPSPKGVYQELRTTGSTYLATLGGNVGIGTTSPTSRLHVVGGANDADPNLEGIQIGTDGTNYALEVTNSGGTPYIDFQNDTSGTDYDMRIRLTGDDTLAIEGGNLTAAIPTAANHVATREYVDAAAGSSFNAKYASTNCFLPLTLTCDSGTRILYAHAVLEGGVGGARDRIDCLGLASCSAFTGNCDASPTGLGIVCAKQN